MSCVNIGVFIQKINLKVVSESVEITPPLIIPSVVELDKPVLPKKGPVISDFVDVPVFRSTTETGTIYNDVLSHSPIAPFGNKSGRSTNVHETVHGINSYLRNKYTASLKKPVNGFYVLEGKGVVIEEPNIKKSDVNKFVPENLRSYRFKTYLAGQQEWDDFPLYLYDEWSAYVLGGKCNIEDAKNGRHLGGWTDGVSGCLGFSIYAVATAMAIKENDPSYWESNDQYRNFTIWMLKDSYDTFNAGRDMDEFKWKKQEDLLIELLTSSEAEPMRSFIKENFEGIWLDSQMRAIYTDDHKYDKTLSCIDCHKDGQEHEFKSLDLKCYKVHNNL